MWTIETHRGSAASFHARDVAEVTTPVVWWFDVVSPALVLGSTQPVGQIDELACARLGIDVVRRRSGGGAVLLEPGDVVWVDVVLPVSDHRWVADVGRSAWWLGEVWRDALDAVGAAAAADTTVHRGALVSTTWSDRVCFAGTGGGEVVSGARKLVGISQRRTRTAARFQCAVHRRWRPEHHVELFAPPAPTVADLAGIVLEVDIDPAVLMAAFTAALARTD